MKGKLLIVEESLRDLKAHWFEYIRTIQQAATANGWKVQVASHREAAPEIIRTFDCFPVFKYTRYLSQGKNKLPGERYYGFVLHSIRCLRVLWPIFKKHSYNATFVPTVLVHHLLAWYVIMRKYPDKTGHLTLFFVTPPGIWDSKNNTTSFPSSTFVLRKMLKLFKSFITSGKVTFAVETREAKNQFETLSGLPFALMPHPVPFSSTPASGHPSGDPDTAKSNTSPSPVSFGCFGFARYEKGSDLLKRAIEEILAKNRSFKGNFTLQWIDPFTTPDGSVCVPGPLLENHPQVKILNRPLASNEYETLLIQTDCIILPYRNSSYFARVSRIAIEAVCNGIPLIYTKGGWLEENAEDFGAGVGIADESLQELANAIQTLYSEYGNFSMQAKKRTNKARNYYAPDHFVALLLGA